jgi:putative ABC transport system permease protein
MTYQQTHRLHDIVGDLSGLWGDTVALDRSYASDLHVGVGDLVQLRLEGVETERLVVATFPYSLSGPPVVLPIALAPTGDVQRRYIVQTETPAAAPGVTEHIETTFADPSSGSDPSIVSVVATDDWIQDSLDNQQRVTQNFLLAVLGLVTIYLVIAMINAVVIGAAARRVEFAGDRLTGLTRGQVVQMALWESLTVVTVGVVLGTIAAAGATIATTAAVSNIVGTRVVAAPWSILGAAVVCALVVVGLAGVMTTLTATRQPPVVVAGARE